MKDIEKDNIIKLIGALIEKYDNIAINAEQRGNNDSNAFHNGVATGLNIAYKVILGIDDDYLDGINKTK